MLYFIKFLYQWILPPAGFVLLLAGITFYMYRKRAQGRLALLIVTLLLYVFSLRVTADALAGTLETWIAPPQDAKGDVILMLGNGAWAGVPDIDGIGQPSGTMGKNMLMTLRLQKATGLPVLISGGTVYEDAGNEAAIAEREFIGMGIEKDKIFCEPNSRNTVENVRFSKKICEENSWKKPIVTVVALQALRTKMIFEREGMDVTIYPTHFRRSTQWHFHPVLDLIPDAGCLADSAAAVREYMGIAALMVHAQ